jgi:hypothetical protein
VGEAFTSSRIGSEAGRIHALQGAAQSGGAMILAQKIGPTCHDEDEGLNAFMGRQPGARHRNLRNSDILRFSTETFELKYLLTARFALRKARLGSHRLCAGAKLTDSRATLREERPGAVQGFIIRPVGKRTRHLRWRSTGVLGEDARHHVGDPLDLRCVFFLHRTGHALERVGKIIHAHVHQGLEAGASDDADETLERSFVDSPHSTLAEHAGYF